MSSWDDSHFTGNRTNFVEGASVDTNVFLQNVLAKVFVDELLQSFGESTFALSFRFDFSSKVSEYLVLKRMNGVLDGSFSYSTNGVEVSLRNHSGHEGEDFVGWFSVVVSASHRVHLSDQIELKLANLFDHGVSEFQSFEHFVFSDFVGSGFHHRDGVHGSSDDEIKISGVGLFDGWENDELTIFHPDTNSCERTCKRQTSHHHGSGHTGESQNSTFVFKIGRKHHGDSLNLIGDSFWEHRSDGTVDLTSLQNSFVGGASIAFHEARSFDFTCCEETFLVIDGHWEEVCSFLSFF